MAGWKKEGGGKTHEGSEFAKSRDAGLRCDDTLAAHDVNRAISGLP